jgi:hypothetical protein
LSPCGFLLDANVLDKCAVSIFRDEVKKLRCGGLIPGFKEGSLKERGKSETSNFRKRVQTNR